MRQHPPCGPRCAPAIAGVLAACALGLGACGSSTASTGASGGGPATVGNAHSPKTAATRTERLQAGRAAPFVAAEADNSIPTFGAEAARSDRAAAEARLQAYLGARAEGDWPAACSGLSAALVRQIEVLGDGKRCAAAYAALAGGAGAAARANPLKGRLLSLRVKGPGGFALFYGPGKQEYVMPMAREGGAWKITQVAPVAYPLGSAAASSP